MKILIVEDSQTQAEHLKNLLEENGHHVDYATNGKEALTHLKQATPDLLISDIMMPVMDGYALCQAVREMEQFKNLPIILLTTLTDTEDIVSGLQCGADHIIPKPYENQYLIHFIDNVMRINKLRSNELKNSHVKVIVNQHEYLITAEKYRILDLLISIYDAAVQKNHDLHEARLKLQELNNKLENKVEERTKALLQETEERKRYERQFLEAQKLESISQLAGGIAHDFNNLLMIMQVNAEMLKTKLEKDEEGTAILNKTLSAMSRGVELIKRLMAYSRSQQLQPKLLNLRDLTTNMIKLLKPLLGEAIEITTILPDNVWPVYLDPGQLENALVNLAVNARDAMKRKGCLTIELKNVTLDEMIATEKYQIPEGRYVRISISDNGEGIPPRLIDRVFEPFFTTKGVGKGTGLGLSMVYGFIKQSHGHVTIYSELGHGTTVNLFLPKSEIIAESAAVSQEEPVMSLQGSETILLVEDEATLRTLSADYLIRLGYHVLQAENGNVAVEIFQKEKNIALLLTDIMMPGGILGPELAEWALSRYLGLKVLFVSGYPQNALLGDKTITNQNIPLLVKPYALSELGKMVRSILDKK
jgi:signal transduction histidine kinase